MTLTTHSWIPVSAYIIKKDFANYTQQLLLTLGVYAPQGYCSCLFVLVITLSNVASKYQYIIHVLLYNT